MAVVAHRGTPVFFEGAGRYVAKVGNVSAVASTAQSAQFAAALAAAVLKIAVESGCRDPLRVEVE